MKYYPNIFIAILLLFCLNCKENSNENIPNSNKNNTLQDSLFLSKIIALDTISTTKYDEFIQNEINKKDALTPHYQYFTYLNLKNQNQIDSANSVLNKIQIQQHSNDFVLLKEFQLLNNEISINSSVASPLMNDLIEKMHEAESNKSRILYKYYDLVAQSYFQNNNTPKALEYSELYFKNHPFQDNVRIKQRYHDIQFLLWGNLMDYDKMKLHNAEARRLALQINDSLAIARTYDSETRIFAMQGDWVKAISSSRKYINYLKNNDKINQIAYNNLANTFLHANQVDSAIHYFHKANELMNEKPLAAHVADYYNGLLVSYKIKKDYQNALVSADSAYTISSRNRAAIEAAKIEEIEQKYASDQKDKNIQELEKSNNLNEQIIRQQNWMLFSSILALIIGIAFFLVVLRQRILKNKNELLAEENKRLQTEQRMLQSQLNPHFIFNSIANLQSLVGSGEKKLAMNYLNSFSTLLRNILEQNRKEFILIEEEISTLSHYLALQQMRFPDLFEYKIEVENQIEPDKYLIPPMLIQPFVENSIEHGFRNIDYKGKLDIYFKLNDNQVFITIEDNGKGIEKSPNSTKNKKSLSRIIIKERLEALFSQSKSPAFFEVKDKIGVGNQGVIVTIQLPIILD